MKYGTRVRHRRKGDEVRGTVVQEKTPYSMICVVWDDQEHNLPYIYGKYDLIAISPLEQLAECAEED